MPKRDRGLRECCFCGAFPNSYWLTTLDEAYCDGHSGVQQCVWCTRVRMPNEPGRACRACTSLIPRDRMPFDEAARRVLHWLGRFFPQHGLGAVPVNLVDSASLPENQFGLTNFSITGTQADVRIHLPSDCPPEFACEWLAHEYGHVLLTVDPVRLDYPGPHALAHEVEEGYCEVLRYLWVHEHGVTSRDRRLQSVSDNLIDTYRIGFHRVWADYQRINSVALLRTELLTHGASTLHTAPAGPTPVAPPTPSFTGSVAEPPRPASGPRVRPRLPVAVPTASVPAVQPVAQTNEPRPTLRISPHAGAQPTGSADPPAIEQRERPRLLTQ